MDWTKAKSILIVALIVTNLVLIFTYAFKDDTIVNTDESVLSDTIELLETKNIFVKTTIPQKYSRMPVLSVEYDKMNQDLIEEQLAIQKTIPIEAQNDEAIIQITTEFIDNCNLLTENVEFESLEKRDGKTIVTYKNYINSILVEDSYIICTVKNGKVDDLQRYWLNPIEFSKVKKEIIPAAAALIKFMSENEADEKIYVEEISLVYWLDSASFDVESPVSDTAFPAWKITYNRGKTEYIMAFEQ